ncbi:uncharacterized protein LOC121078870 isoform X2 [Cygnus olor]|uniref:uncharacterized protein LOC121078870 isoform X2 n=1 Tax=Cygnus olor TaxID=8869 RepID=UPI001ADEBC3D|nr:uncharacterized protein LOC121078870 isoform X2 [Cygnus olor]
MSLFALRSSCWGTWEDRLHWGQQWGSHQPSSHLDLGFAVLGAGLGCRCGCPVLAEPGTGCAGLEGGGRQGVLCASHLQLQEVNESVMGSSQLLRCGFAPSLWSAELPTLLQGFSIRVVLGRGCAAPGMPSQLHPHCKALCGHGSPCKGPCISWGSFHRPWWALDPVGSIGARSSLQTLTQQLVLQPSMCLLAAEGSVQQLYVVQSFLNENEFQRTFRGQNLNFTMSQHSPKPEKQRWFLLGGEGGSCCHSLSYAHTHTQWFFFLSHPTFLLQKTSNTLWKCYFLPKLLPFCCVLTKQPAGFPWAPLPARAVAAVPQVQCQRHPCGDSAEPFKLL